MPIEFSEATWLSDDLKSQLVSAAKRGIEQHARTLDKILSNEWNCHWTCSKHDVSSPSEVHPYVKKLPNQQSATADEVWKRFKDHIPRYTHHAKLKEKMKSEHKNAYEDFKMEVEGFCSPPLLSKAEVSSPVTKLSEKEQESIIMQEFQKEIWELEGSKCRGFRDSFDALHAEMEKQYGALFKDGRLYPEFTSRVAKTLKLFINKPTTKDLDTIPSVSKTTQIEYSSKDNRDPETALLRRQAGWLSLFSSDYHKLNGRSHC